MYFSQTLPHTASHLSEKSEWCSLAGQFPATVNEQTRLNNGKQHTLPKIHQFWTTGQKILNFRFLPKNCRKWKKSSNTKNPHSTGQVSKVASFFLYYASWQNPAFISSRRTTGCSKKMSHSYVQLKSASFRCLDEIGSKF